MGYYHHKKTFQMPGGTEEERTSAVAQPFCWSKEEEEEKVRAGASWKQCGGEWSIPVAALLRGPTSLPATPLPLTKCQCKESHTPPSWMRLCFTTPPLFRRATQTLYTRIYYIPRTPPLYFITCNSAYPSINAALCSSPRHLSNSIKGVKGPFCLLLYCRTLAHIY